MPARGKADRPLKAVVARRDGKWVYVGELDAVPLTGKRPAWWPGQGWTETSIYEADALRPGHQIDGPVIIEAPLTTVVVPPGMRYRIDRHGLGLLQTCENGGAR